MTIETPYKKIIEGILFVSDEPLSVSQLADTTKIGEAEVISVLTELMEDYAPGKHGFHLRSIAGGYRFFAGEEATPYLNELFSPRYQKLSQAALETLSIIAYKEPVTRGEMELIRGVNCDAPLRSLQERGLVEERGRKDAPGRPVLFGTTKTFLSVFGLNSVTDLPEAKWRLQDLGDEAPLSEDNQEE